MQYLCQPYLPGIIQDSQKITMGKWGEGDNYIGISTPTLGGKLGRQIGWKGKGRHTDEMSGENPALNRIQSSAEASPGLSSSASSPGEPTTSGRTSGSSASGSDTKYLHEGSNPRMLRIILIRVIGRNRSKNLDHDSLFLRWTLVECIGGRRAGT